VCLCVRQSGTLLFDAYQLLGLVLVRSQNSESIEVVRTYQGDGEYIRQLEKEIHEELNAVRWQYEYFYGGAEVDLVIARLENDFSFTPAH
jgi:hypothetical protein